MKFHLPSFVLGLATGASGAALAPRLRPLALEIATGFYRILDAALLRVARGREDLADLFAEARSRARDMMHVNRARTGTHRAEASA
jgi:hypothetical protein